jgi:hypothetical protein
VRLAGLLAAALVWLLAASAASATCRPDGDKVLNEIAIVEADGLVCDVRDFAGRVVSRMVMPGASPHLLVVVHGRGLEPRRFVAKRGWLRELETGYGVTAIMLHWPSWRGPIGWPEAEARNAGDELAFILAEIGRLRDDTSLNIASASLLTHSMGSYVLAEATLRGAFATPRISLDTVLVHAPAVPLAGHAQWLQRVRTRHGVFVVLNDRDMVLRSAVALPAVASARLGVSADALAHGEEPLAAGVTYIDASLVGPRHAHFLPSFSQGLPELQMLQAQIVLGLAPKKPDSIEWDANPVLWKLGVAGTSAASSPVPPID